MCVKHIPSPAVAARSKVEHIYTGPINNSTLGQDMINCDPDVSQLKISFYYLKLYLLFMVQFINHSSMNILMFILEMLESKESIGLSSEMKQGQLVVHTTKQYPTEDCTGFYVLGRVLSGTLHAHQNVRLLGENYSLNDEEDSRLVTIGRLWIYEARYKVHSNILHSGIQVSSSVEMAMQMLSFRTKYQ